MAENVKIEKIGSYGNCYCNAHSGRNASSSPEVVEAAETATKTSNVEDAVIAEAAATADGTTLAVALDVGNVITVAAIAAISASIAAEAATDTGTAESAETVLAESAMV